MAYGAAALLALLWVRASPPSHERDLASALRTAAESGGQRLVIHEGQAFVAFFPGRGYTLTLCVRGDARYAPADFFSLERRDGVLVGEPFVIQGAKGTGNLLVGAELERYLQHAGLDEASVDETFRRYYGRR